MTVHTKDQTPTPTRVSRGWRIAGSVTLLLVAAFGTNVLLSGVLPPTWPLPILQVLIAAGTVAVAVPLTAWTGRRLRPVRSLHHRGLRWGGGRDADAIAGVIVGLVAGVLPMGVAIAIGGFGPVAVLDGGDVGLLLGLALLIVAMVLVATWEELLLRGVLVGELVAAFRRRISPRSAAVLAVTLGAVIFGLGHAGQPDRPVLLTTWIVAGLVFGAVYVLDGRLALVIGAHAGFNIAHNAVVVRADVEGTERLSALLRVEQASDTWWMSPGGIIELAGFLLLLVLALLWLRSRDRRSRPGENPGPLDPPGAEVEGSTQPPATTSRTTHARA